VNKKITILIADDHPLIRKALRNDLEKQADFELVGEASDGEEAVKLATQLVPNVVIMDITMPKLNGLEAIEQIKMNCPQIAILALTIHTDHEHILGILKAGAAGYLTKSVFGEDVIQAIRAIISGEAVISGEVFQKIIEYAIVNKTKPMTLEYGEKLTVRELEVLQLAAIGMSNKDIAIKLNISIRTVKAHLAEIFDKMRVSSRTEAIFTALRAGLIRLENIQLDAL
jgi:DNA-binding NarL/FixJ family response regulator